MSRRSNSQQSSLWISPDEVASGPGHPFYERLNKIFSDADFDEFVEALCSRYYARKGGRPSIPPGVYFRMLLIGYFERIDSERGICWRCSDSFSLRQFLGLALDERVPDHSSMSRIRTRLSLEVHEEVFAWVLKTLAVCGLVDGKTLGVDATTLEANAALRSIVRRDTGEGYTTFLEGLVKESGVESPTRSDIAKLDRQRPGKGSNKEWVNPHDPEAQISKMKDGRTHLAHKAEHAVDMSGSGAVVAVTVHGGAKGDTQSLEATLDEAQRNLDDLREDLESADQIHAAAGTELVADKGYHSNRTLLSLTEQEYRTYVSEPDRGRRSWKNKEEERAATHANRRRIKGARGQRLLRLRGELLERPFAHYLEAGGMRRTHLRGHENILKRLLVHVAGFNLGLLMRDLLGAGTPRELAELRAALSRCLWLLIRGYFGIWTAIDLWLTALLERCRWHCAFVIAWLRTCGSPDERSEAFSTGC